MMVARNGEEQADELSQGCYDPLYDPVDSDSEMSVEKFDDVVAALTFTATIITITLGFLFRL